MPALPAAVLFDMDGTLVDTEHLWLQTTAELAAGLGHTLTEEDLPEVLGRAVDHTAAHLYRMTRTRFTVDALAELLNDAFSSKVAAEVVPGPAHWRCSPNCATPACLPPWSRPPPPRSGPGPRQPRRSLVHRHPRRRGHRAHQARPRPLPGRRRSTRAGPCRLRGRRGHSDRGRLRARRRLLGAGCSLHRADRRGRPDHPAGQPRTGRSGAALRADRANEALFSYRCTARLSQAAPR